MGRNVNYVWILKLLKHSRMCYEVIEFQTKISVQEFSDWHHSHLFLVVKCCHLASTTLGCHFLHLIKGAQFIGVSTHCHS